ncbi:MAG TPA: hypothetical protein VLS49_05380 [Usitatibacter sp.]|nr:hypothetical protein [Usitatibacter sp.]
MTRLLRLASSAATWAAFAVAKRAEDRAERRRYGAEWVADYERRMGRHEA